MTSRASARPARTSGEVVMVSPPVLEFRDVPSGDKRHGELCLVNTTNCSRTLRLSLPTSKAFKVCNTQELCLAPGLGTKVRVEFDSDDPEDCHDNLLLIVDGEPVSVPLHCYRPTPKLELEGDVDFGTVTMFNSLVTRQVTLCNAGFQEGYFSIKVPKGSSFSLCPTSGVVGRSGSTNASIKLKASLLEKSTACDILETVEVEVRASANPNAEVIDTLALSLQASVRDHRLVILDQDGASPVSELAFGSLYYGSETSERVVLHNDGPAPVNFVTLFETDSEDGVDDGAKGCSGGKMEDGNPASWFRKMVSVYPSEGTIEAYGKFELRLIFKPRVQPVTKGWKSRISLPPKAEVEVPIFIHVIETKARGRVTLRGSALPLQVSVSENGFDFGDCQVHGLAMRNFSISNESAELPITYNLERLAHFKTSPSKGTLAPKQTVAVNVTFSPNQLGSFNQNMTLMLCKGISKIPLSLVAQCTKLAASHAMRPAVTKNHQALLDARTKHIKPFSHSKFTTTTPHQIPPVLLRNAPKVLPVDPPFYDTNLTLGYTSKEVLGKKQHTESYNHFMRQVAQDAREEEERRQNRKTFSYTDDIDLGMEPASGLEPPEPILPKLPAVKSRSAVPKSNNHAGAILSVQNKTPLKCSVWKSTPNTLDEISDCQAILSPLELRHVTSVAKELSYGVLCKRASSKGTLVLTNPLTRNLLYQVEFDADELKLAGPATQVVPPGCAAMFDMVFTSAEEIQFSTTMEIVVNNRYRHSVPVSATVVPISLEMEPSNVNFVFPPDCAETFLTEVVTVRNPQDNVAEFEWTIKTGNEGEEKGSTEGPGAEFVTNIATKTLANHVFSVTPCIGTIPPFCSLDCQVSYCPSYRADNECTFVLSVAGGQQLQLNCTGDPGISRCTMLEKNLSLGTVAVGMSTQRTLRIRNTGTHVGYYETPAEVAPCISISPSYGRVPAGGYIMLNVTFAPVEAATYEGTVVVYIRGQKPLRSVVKGCAEVPVVKVLEQTLLFEDVYVGTQASTDLTFVNSGNVPASITVDLSAHVDFRLRLKPHHVEVGSGLDQEAGKNEDAPQLRDYSLDAHNVPDSITHSSEWVDGEERHKGHVYSMEIDAGKALRCDLLYTPTSVSQKVFNLPVTVTGVLDNYSLCHMVKISSLASPIILSEPSISFGEIVVPSRKGKSEEPHQAVRSITLTNQSGKRVSWCLDLEAAGLTGSSPFEVVPTFGVLDAAETVNLCVTFTPRTAGSFQVILPVLLGKDRHAYAEWIMEGMAIRPSLKCDQSSGVIMPVVPLGVRSTANFVLLNHGYHDMTVKVVVPDSPLVELSVHFPEGQQIVGDTFELPVQVSFVSREPVTFSLPLKFLDCENEEFAVTVHGTSDNCIFTTFPFFNKDDWSVMHKGCYHRHKKTSQAAIQKARPAQQQQLDITAAAAAATAMAAAAIAPPVQASCAPSITDSEESLNDVGAPAAYHAKPNFLEMAAHACCRWASSILSLPLSQLHVPESFVQSNGRLIYEIVEFLTGKRAPGRVSRDKMPTGHLKTVLKKRAALYCRQYASLLNYLKGMGGMLATVKPWFLLSLEQFLALHTSKDGMLDAEMASLEDDWSNVSRDAWTTVILQVQKLFSLQRVTPKVFSTLPLLDQSVLNVAGNTATSSHTNSVYSVGESLILRWLSCHHRIQNGSTRSITNFESDMRDGLALAAILKAHVPSLGSAGLNAMYKVCQDPEQFNHNALRVIAALRYINLDFGLQVGDIVQPNPCDLLSVCLQLFDCLPAYLAKTSIAFSCSLHESVTKTVEISNPSQKPITYNVRVDNDKDFSVAQNIIEVPPKASVQFNITFHCRFQRPRHGTVFFLPMRSSSMWATGQTLVFELESQVNELRFKPTTIPEIPCYEGKTVEVKITNPFQTAGNFHLELLEGSTSSGGVGAGSGSRPRITKGKSSEAFGTTVGATGVGISQLNLDSASATDDAKEMLPRAFWTTVKNTKLRADESVNIPVRFLPYEPGTYRCTLLFVDEDVGEFYFDLEGTAALPRPLDSLVWNCSGQSSYEREICLTYRNVRKEKALSIRPEGNKEGSANEIQTPGMGALKRQRLGGGGGGGPKVFQVTYSSAFFTGPSEIAVQSAGPLAPIGQRGAERPSNRLPLCFTPKGIGRYTCKVVLKSADDVRVFLVEGVVTAATVTQVFLEFSLPARESVTQEIPLSTGSSIPADCVFNAEITGASFSGPSSIVAKASTSDIGAVYPLTFHPEWVGSCDGVLTLTRSDSEMEVQYQLRGIGLEPRAEDSVTIDCIQMLPSSRKFRVVNHSREACNFKVATDLSDVSGEPSLTIEAGQEAMYELHVHPSRTFQQKGCLSFTNETTEHYQWYAVELQVAPSPPEDTLDVKGTVRETSVVKVPLSNPLPDKGITFNVTFHGQGLAGDHSLTLLAGDTRAYNLVYAPVAPGKSEGVVRFQSKDVPELWYRLNLEAVPAKPEVLPTMVCELGAAISRSISVKNPSKDDVKVTIDCSNNKEFWLELDGTKLKGHTALMPGRGALKLDVGFAPSSVGTMHKTNVVVSHPRLGSWVFKVEGQGRNPTPMSALNVSAPVDHDSTAFIKFMNPFFLPVLVEVSIDTDSSSFELIARKRINVGPRSMLDIPVRYLPRDLDESHAVVKLAVHCDGGLSFEQIQEIHGVPEKFDSCNLVLRCVARDQLEETLQVALPMKDGPSSKLSGLYHEVIYRNEEERQLIGQILNFTMDSVASQGPNGELMAELSAVFSPFRPMHSTVQLVVRKKEGSRQTWKFPVDLIVDPAPVDDVVTLEAVCGKKTSVGLHLNNRVPSSTTFHAYFSTSSPEELQVEPTHGTLPGCNSSGRLLTLTYDAPLVPPANPVMGSLCVETSEMQWLYDINVMFQESAAKSPSRRPR